MSPIEQLKDGIETGNWSLICDAYAGLTGQRLQAPASGTNEVGVIAKVRAAIANALDSLLVTPVDAPKHPLRPPIKREREEAPNPDAANDLRRVAKGDINDAPAEEQTSIAGSAPTHSAYGGMNFVSQTDIDPQEVKANEEIAASANSRKKRRPAPVDWTVNCSDCQREFKVNRKPTSGIGQRCPSCMRKVAR